jgi:hypothetical protein
MIKTFGMAVPFRLVGVRGHDKWAGGQYRVGCMDHSGEVAAFGQAG